jgi:hypothetical protein
METPISVSDLVPNYYETAEDNEDDYDGEDTRDHVDDLTYDICNLVACDYHPLQLETTGSDVNEIIQASATRATQLLINRFAFLPSLPLLPNDASSDYFNCLLNPQKLVLLLFCHRNHFDSLGIPSTTSP